MLFFQSNFIVRFLALVIAVTIHEAAHAFTAFRFGDFTPQYQGRLTLNPLKHLSLLGTLMIVFGPIGWGNPVIYDPRNFRDYKWGTVFTALAGPASNFILAFLCAIPLKYVDFGEKTSLFFFFDFSVNLNIVLMAFNLLPIPPLDGSKVLLAFVPKKYQAVYDNWITNSGIHPFLLIFIGDYLLSRITGISILGEIIGFVLIFVRSFIFLGL